MLKLTSSWRADAREGTEPRPEAGRPALPDWLDDVAKQCWEQLLPQLEQMGVLTRIDGNAIARYCQGWSDWRKCIAFIGKNGMFYALKDDSGAVKCLQQYPHVGIRNKLAVELSRLEQEFGLTPSARTRIEVKLPDGPGDELDDFIQRRA
jgi:P27 family predicted phage terminase small subunit